MTDRAREFEVGRALSLLVNAARTSPPLREAVRQVEDEILRLRVELDEAQLRSIEARNPGIDMEGVRRIRGSWAGGACQE